MPAKRVDFYHLQTADSEEHLQFTCRLIEKVYLHNHQLFVYCQTQDQAEQLDEALWIFRPESFIPHHLQGEGPFPPAPVQIGTTPPTQHYQDILLNFAHPLPDCVHQFQRIIEIIYDNDAVKTLARERYRVYQGQGTHLSMHAIHYEPQKEIRCDAV